jgi:hypothetical protein
MRGDVGDWATFRTSRDVRRESRTRTKTDILEPDYALMLDDVEFEVSLAFNYPSLSAYSCYWLWRAVQFFSIR